MNVFFRKAIPLNKNEGIYVRNTKSGNVSVSITISYHFLQT